MTGGRRRPARPASTVRLRWVGIALAGAMAMGLVHHVVHDAVHRTDDPQEDPGPVASSAPAGAPSPERGPEGDHDPDGQDLRAPSSAAAPDAPDRDPLADRWDAMSTAERTEVQRRRFVEAVADARRGVEVQRNLVQARDALTLLRTELHGTERGRAEHRKLEEQYDTLADRIESTPGDPRRERDPR